MGRKLALSVGMTLIVMLSAGLAGGQVGSGTSMGTAAPGGGVGFLWWGTHEPIYIYGNDDFTVENGVLSGSGTASDPYIIEGWRVDAPRADYGIYIDHTTAFFIVRDCVIERSRIAGVYLNSVRNGLVRDVQIGLSDTAIHLLNSDCNALLDNVIADCLYGVVMAADSEGNLISGNSFFDIGHNGVDLMRANRWCDGGVGNYWSDYVGCDRNGDGIGDTPYFPLRDACPLMAPRAEWTGVTTAGLTYSGNWVSPDGSLVVTSQTPISLVAADPGAGLAEIRYAIDRGPWMIYTGPIHLNGEDGRRVIAYYGVDHLGNAADIETVAFIVDNHPPKTVLEVGQPVFVDERGTWVSSQTPIVLRRTQESTYGQTITYFRVDSRNWLVYDGPFVLYVADGSHQISYYSRNASGVAEDLQTAILHKDDAPPSTRGARSSSSAIDVVVGMPEETPAAQPEQPAEQPAEAPVSGPAETAPEEPADEPASDAEPVTEAQTDTQTPSAALPESTPEVVTPETQTPSATTDEETSEEGAEGGEAETEDVQTESETAS